MSLTVPSAQVIVVQIEQGCIQTEINQPATLRLLERCTWASTPTRPEGIIHNRCTNASRQRSQWDTVPKSRLGSSMRYNERARESSNDESNSCGSRMAESSWSFPDGRLDILSINSPCGKILRPFHITILQQSTLREISFVSNWQWPTHEYRRKMLVIEFWHCKSSTTAIFRTFQNWHNICSTQCTKYVLKGLSITC